MDSFEWNKVFGAFLALAFVVMGINFLSDGIYHSNDPETPGFAIEGGEAIAATSPADKGPSVEPIVALLASADLAKGEKVGKKCVACHTFNEGGANKVGPSLYGIVNRPIAGIDGFGYSGALKTYAADKTWTYEELNAFLYKPKAHVKGTSMGFAGLKKTEDRAAMIAYLRSLAATPVPLPEG
ncbi:MAG: c-type cytochrome [Rhizobiaceae bacterium]